MKPNGGFWPQRPGEARKPRPDVDVPAPGKKLPPSVEEKLKTPPLGTPKDEPGRRA